MSRLRSWLCGVFGGHRELLVIEPGHVRLACARCGRETRGWAVDLRPKAAVLLFRKRA